MARLCCGFEDRPMWPSQTGNLMPSLSKPPVDGFMRCRVPSDQVPVNRDGADRKGVRPVRQGTAESVGRPAGRAVEVNPRILPNHPPKLQALVSSRCPFTTLGACPAVVPVMRCLLPALFPSPLQHARCWRHLLFAAGRGPQ